MNVLLVHCHPVPDSFGAALRDTTRAALERGGHVVELLDLYARGFDPVMSEAERRGYNELVAGVHPLPEHAAALARAEALVFVYPTWWYGQPAMLKGWLERVWTPGTAFEIDTGGGGIVPLLRHIRKLAIVTTGGASRGFSWLVGQPGRRTIERGLRPLCARRCSTLFLAHYDMDTSTPVTRAAFLAKVDRRMERF